MLEVSGRLEEIILSMNVPQYRIHDAQWLFRNLWLKNRHHKDYDEAMRLLREIVSKVMKKKEIERIYNK